MAKVRVVTAEVVEQGGNQDFEQGRASVGGHVVGGEASDEVEAEDRLPVAGEQDLRSRSQNFFFCLVTDEDAK